MPSRKNETKSTLKFFGNSAAWLLNQFWPIPSPLTGIRMMSDGNDIVVIPNGIGYVKNFPAPKNANLLIVDTGGFLPKFASGFDHVNLSIVYQQLALYKERQRFSENIRVFVPQSMARYLNWNEGVKYEDFSFSIIPDNPLSRINQNKIENNISVPSWINRLLYALPIILGQVILFAIPLSVFGFQALYWGEAILILAGLLLAIVWKFLKGYGWAKGLVTGVCTGLFLWGTVYVIQIPVEFLPKTFIGILLCTVWMGVVYEGVRSG